MGMFKCDVKSSHCFKKALKEQFTQKLIWDDKSLQKLWNPKLIWKCVFHTLVPLLQMRAHANTVSLAATERVLTS